MTFVTFLALSMSGGGPCSRGGRTSSHLVVFAKGATAFLVDRRSPPAARHGRPPYPLFLSQSTSRRYHGSRPPSVWLSSGTRSTTTTTTTTTNTDPPPTNQELVERRLRAAREKHEARQRSTQERVLRNLQLKRLVSTTAAKQQRDANAGQQPRLYALRVTVSPELREQMKHQLRGRERRGRVFVEESSGASTSVAGFRQELQRHFASLRRDSYIVQASFPTIIETTNGLNETVRAVEYPNSEAQSNHSLSGVGDDGWTIETDDDVLALLSTAREFQRLHPDLFARPTMVLQLVPNPNAPPSPPPPAYLEGMQDPRNSSTLTMLSFYAFPPMGIPDPDAFALQLRKRFKPFHALGRVYVAAEGVNAQMSVPTNVVPNFVRGCQSIPNFGEYIENGINIDPIPLPRSDLFGAEPSDDDDGATIPTTPFKSLHVRVRRQVVADGLDKSYDWQSAGYDMPPLEWHEALRQATLRRQQLQLTTKGSDSAAISQQCPEGDEPLPILLDCRNKYETDIGTFEGAEPLNTENFRESWGVLEERLKDVPKDAPIMVRIESWGPQQGSFVHFNSHHEFSCCTQ
jgi:UPF0176 acylphosphatase like domain